MVDTICAIPEYLEVLSLCCHGCKDALLPRQSMLCLRLAYIGTHHIPFIGTVPAKRAFNISISGLFCPLNVYKLKAHFFCYRKCLSYLGTGQSHFTFLYPSKASPSPVPKSMNFAIVSYMMLRLEFPQMISSSGVTPSIGAKSALASGRPSRPP